MSRLRLLILLPVLWLNTMIALSAEGMEGYTWSELNISTGLPSNFVDDIYQDHDGFVWICARNAGVVRYDGYEYRNMGVGHSLSPLMSNSPRNVSEDAFRRLWIAFDEGTQVVDLRTMLPIVPRTSNASLDQQLRKLIREKADRVFADAQGDIFVLTTSHLYCLQTNSQGVVVAILSLNIVPNPTGGCLVAGAGRGEVFASWGGALYTVRRQGGKLLVRNLTLRYPQIKNHIVNDVRMFAGRLWMATTQGLFCSDGKAYRAATHAIPHDFVNALALSPKGQLMVGTLCGVAIMDKGEKTVDVWSAEHSTVPLSSNFVNCIYVRDNRVWIGTEVGGITLLTPRLLNLTNYVHTDNPSSLSSGCVNAMWAEANGTLWVGTVEGGLNRRAPGAKTFTHYTAQNSALTHNSVSTLTADPYHRLWIGTWGGGVCFVDMQNPERVVPIKVDEAHREAIQFVGALIYDKRNKGLWIGSNAGVFFLDEATGKVIDPFPGCRNLRGMVGSAITPDGELWMGCINGLLRVDLKKPRQQAHYIYKVWGHKLDAPDSRIEEKIYSLCVGHDGTLWVGSAGYGLYKMVKDAKGDAHFINYSQRDGLANNTVRGITQDHHGRLWIVTDHGLSVMDVKTNTFDSFYESAGLVSSQFYFNGAITSPAGNVFLGSEKGLTEIRPTDRHRAEKDRLRFTALYVDNALVTANDEWLDTDISSAEEIKLHESLRSFTIEFSSLNYGPENTGSYSYRMRGYEDQWIPLPPGQHSVRYSTLPAGHYVFEVRYDQGLSGSDPQTIAIDVVVHPYFYRSWWFIFLVLAVVVALLYVAYQRRLSAVHRHEVRRLYTPIAEALNDSKAPEVLVGRIQNIISNSQLYDRSLEKTSKQKEEQHAAHQRNFMDQVMRVMEQNYANSEFGVTELCEAVGMSRGVMSKKIKDETGVSTSQFIRNYRLDIARRSLMNPSSNHNIADVAYSVGFNDPKYFTRCFSNRFGIAPSAIDGVGEKEQEDEEGEETK